MKTSRQVTIRLRSACGGGFGCHPESNSAGSASYPSAAGVFRRVAATVLRAHPTILSTTALCFGALLYAPSVLRAQTAGAAPEAKVEESVYKKTPQGDLKMYVHFPPGWTARDKRPAIVFFFGGGWTSGRITQFEPQAKYLAQRGMVAARADYRVRSRHGTTPDKCVEDAKSAVRWLRANAARLGIDPQRIVASGGSAGGHIAACTATIPDDVAPGPQTRKDRVWEPDPPSGVVGGVSKASRLPTAGETPATQAAGLQAENLSISSRPNLLVLFNPVLNTVALGEKYGMSEIGRKISPNHYLSKDVPPAIIFFGAQDQLNEGGKEYIAKAKDLGLEAQMYMAPGQGHGFFNRSPWQERTTFLMDEFLAAHGYLQGKPTLELPPGGVVLTKYDPAR